jgi:low temperature requirement protein LtrA
MIGISIACWVLASVFTAVILRAKIQPSIRHAFKIAAWVHTGSVLLVAGSTLLRTYVTGVMLPAWFIACIFAGMLGPWLVALHLAGRESQR